MGGPRHSHLSCCQAGRGRFTARSELLGVAFPPSDIGAANPRYDAGMKSQLRIYDIKPGMMDEFAAKVDEELIPIRLDYGFTRSGPWIVEETYQYVWIVHYDGKGTFEEVDERYYADPRRGEMSFNPMDYITRVDARMLTPI